MWLDNLKELKAAKNMTVKQIAIKANLPERTVARIFSGDTDSPYVDTLNRIALALDSTLDSILADTKSVVSSTALSTMQAELDKVTGEKALLMAELSIANDKVAALASENDLLKLKLQHKEELIALHNYYMKMNG